MPGLATTTYTPTGSLDWMDDANCREVGPGPFFDWETQRFPRSETTKAHAVAFCRECDVQSDCLAFALNNLGFETDYGIWGGLDRDQRRQLKARRRR